MIAIILSGNFIVQFFGRNLYLLELFLICHQLTHLVSSLELFEQTACITCSKLCMGNMHQACVPALDPVEYAEAASSE